MVYTQRLPGRGNRYVFGLDSYVGVWLTPSSPLGVRLEKPPVYRMMWKEIQDACKRVTCTTSGVNRTLPEANTSRCLTGNKYFHLPPKVKDYSVRLF